MTRIQSDRKHLTGKDQYYSMNDILSRPLSLSLYTTQLNPTFDGTHQLLIVTHDGFEVTPQRLHSCA